uniref:Uncharacterized protein n=1 Tax=Trichobilharzia regenti TaxID=157069 RepID=A0AA85K3U1_TRIRE
LSVSRTEEINQLTQRVINLSHLQHLSVIAYETRSIYEKVKASMRDEYHSLTGHLLP